jgi:hypothetical protein
MTGQSIWRNTEYQNVLEIGLKICEIVDLKTRLNDLELHIAAMERPDHGIVA